MDNNKDTNVLKDSSQFSNPILDPYEEEIIEQLINKYHQMSQLNKINMMVFLQCIHTPNIKAICEGNANRVLNFCFTYQGRDLPDDGNPALIAILELMPENRLEVKENEYTKKLGIWLCYDYTVYWVPEKVNKLISSSFNRLMELKC